MADDADLFDDVPLSPIATSTQIPVIQGTGFFPPLPAFPNLPENVAILGAIAGSSRQLDRSSQRTGPQADSGSRQLDLSPIAETRTRQRTGPQAVGGSRQLDLSPITETRSSQRTEPLAAIGRGDATARRTSFTGLGNWVIRSVELEQHERPAQTIGGEDVVEIEDDSNSGSSVTIVRDSPVEEIVVDSDSGQSDSDAEDRPNNPEPPDVVLVDELVPLYPINNPTQSNENDVVINVREVTVGTTEQDITTVPGEPGTTHGDGDRELVQGSSRVVPGTPSQAPVQPQGVQALVGNSPADFRSPKRKRVASPVKPTGAGAELIEEGDEEDGECCPICFESWTTSGGHRLSSLKCGHLFGQSCIEKWLRGQGGKCPQCNAKAKRQDVRVLYAKSIKAVDTTERDRALKDLDKEKELRRKAEMDGAQVRLQYQMAIEENNKMRLEIETLKSQLRRAGSSIGPSTSTSRNPDTSITSQAQIGGKFCLDKSIKIWDAGNCRVMAYCPSLATLVVSQPSASPLFPGFGVKKISALDFKTSQYLTVHSKAIRDVAFHPSVEDGMLLSCGLDKKVKMTSLLSNAVVQSYDVPMPAWSCVWNADDRNYFYAGLQNGFVMEFDIRNTDGAVTELNKEGSRSPVASLRYMNSDMGAEFRSGGLMVGQLDKVSFFESLSTDQRRLHLLPLEGLLTSLSFEPHTRHMLASYRPTARHATIRHQLCEMFHRNISGDPTVIDNVCSCNVVHTFHGGRTQTVLSRSILLPHPGDNNRLLVCGGDETNNSIHIWDSGTGQLTQSLVIGGVTVDMCSFRFNNITYLAALTDKQCKVFKWT